MESHAAAWGDETDKRRALSGNDDFEKSCAKNNKYIMKYQWKRRGRPCCQQLQGQWMMQRDVVACGMMSGKAHDS